VNRGFHAEIAALASRTSRSFQRSRASRRSRHAPKSRDLPRSGRVREVDGSRRRSSSSSHGTSRFARLAASTNLELDPRSARGPREVWESAGRGPQRGPRDDPILAIHASTHAMHRAVHARSEVRAEARAAVERRSGPQQRSGPRRLPLPGPCSRISPSTRPRLSARAWEQIEWWVSDQIVCSCRQLPTSCVGLGSSTRCA